MTGAEDDPKALEGIRTAVARMEERFGPFVSLSPRGTCAHVGDGGSRRELSAEATFERGVLVRFADEKSEMTCICDSSSAFRSTFGR